VSEAATRRRHIAPVFYDLFIFFIGLATPVGGRTGLEVVNGLSVDSSGKWQQDVELHLELKVADLLDVQLKLVVVGAEDQVGFNLAVSPVVDRWLRVLCQFAQEPSASVTVLVPGVVVLQNRPAFLMHFHKVEGSRPVVSVVIVVLIAPVCCG
jgi:hypothetical protein